MSPEADRHSERFLTSNADLFNEARERDKIDGKGSFDETTPVLGMENYPNELLIKELAKSVGMFQALIDEGDLTSEKQKEARIHCDHVVNLSTEVTKRKFNHSVKVTQNFSDAFQKFKADLLKNASSKTPFSASSASVTIKINAPNTQS